MECGEDRRFYFFIRAAGVVGDSSGTRRNKLKAAILAALQMVHFVHLLRQSFARHGGRPAVVHRGRMLTYGDVEQRAHAAAGFLQGQGVEKGDRVVLCTTDKLAFLIAHLGSLLAGAVSLPLNPRFTRDELRFFLADSAAKVVVGGAEERRILEALRPELPSCGPLFPTPRCSILLQRRSASRLSTPMMRV